MTPPARPGISATALLLVAACSPGPGSNPVDAAGPLPALVCRSRIDSPFQFAEIARRSEQNLGTSRVADRTGTERNVRVHPDGRTVVFARERSAGDAGSRELFVSSTDGSTSERRLTSNDDFDDEPSWSPDASRIVFSSERTSPRSLWTMDVASGAATQFLPPPSGSRDGEPDWSRATGRIVWSRRDQNGRHSLWIAQDDATGVVPLTDGGPASGADTGDRAPAFSPDGSRVAFVRRAGAATAVLCTVDVATFAVATLVLPDGDVATPRWAPLGDTIWFGIREEARGRTAMRLATIPATGGTPVLQWPDDRWQLEGLDLTGELPPAPTGNAAVALDVARAVLEIAAGGAAFGVRDQLVDADGDAFRVTTATSSSRQIAGINCRFDVPVTAADDVLELRIRTVARATRGGADCFLRTSIYNPVDERFDTAVELPIGDTTSRTLEFRTSSLRHITRERQLRITVIADLAPGAAAELLVDQVAVEFVSRAP
ncbi:MAG: PD40 domain-containing protein [Planctomycetes bacterium]|nr:PD40 domain-containing protein [Planctomycetota bacterium]